MARRLAVALLALLVFAPPAVAADKPATCANLQSVLDGAADGDTITLQGICTGQHFDLPSFPTPSTSPNNYKMWTLRGDPSDGADGFDGSGLTTSQRMLTGVDVHRLEIQNLSFRDGNVIGDGGALDITGESSVGLRSSSFFNNHATGKGGAVHLSQVAPFPGSVLGGFGLSDDVFGSQSDAAEGNSAATGGAVSIEIPKDPNNSSGINGSTFANNQATGNGGAYAFVLSGSGGTNPNFSLSGNVVVDNKAGGFGGGGYAVGEIGSLHVDSERYEGNSVEPITGYLSGDHFGGGLYLGGGLPDLRHNVFRNNAIKAFPDGGDLGGGGVAVDGPDVHVQSEYTRVDGNTVAGLPPASAFESEGGGIFFSSGGGRWDGFLDAIAGNSVGAGGEGGGIYVGAPVASASLELAETTVAGNSSGGLFAGISGGAQDDLLLWNSIVYNGADDIGGFDQFDVQYSDACDDGPFAFDGPGNICSDPLLVGGGDVHQTAHSPTIDRGSDELMGMVGGERNAEDYEGDPRPTDGDGDGHTVDMGADESPAFVAQPPPPPHTPQCSDGADNDGDGAVDGADPGCLAGPTDDNEGDETPGDLVLCGSRDISLVRADLKGSKVSLSGFVATKFAGQRVSLSVRYLGKGGKPTQLGKVTAAADGSFIGRVAKPSRKLFNVARYRAQVGTAKSVELKLPQSLASSSLERVAGGMLELRGQAKPDKKGRYVVRFPAPTTTTGSALYRAETKVLARPGSKRYVKQFARAIGITF
jgi:hypothetical protein